MKKKINSSKKNRPPTKNESRKPSPPVPLVALREQERKLLTAMSDGKVFNVNNYSDFNKIPRSTTRTRLKKLDRIGLVNDKFAEKTITRRGLIYLENTNQIEKQGVGNSRQGGRKSQLSTHWHKFTLPIKDRSKFRMLRLEQLDHKGIKENKLKNLHQIIVTLDDAKIIINPKQIIISLYDVVTDDVEGSDIRCLNRAVEYAEKLKSLGLETEGAMVEAGHWARLESHLANFLYKNVDKKYSLKLDDGVEFWIDCSDVIEDETNNKVVRENFDKALTEIGLGEVDLQDITKIKESLGIVSEFEARHSLKNMSDISKMAIVLNKATKRINEISEIGKDTALGLNALTNFTKSQLPNQKQEVPKVNPEPKYEGYFG